MTPKNLTTVAVIGSGLANKRGVHDWTRRNGKALVRTRMDGLFRWLAADRTKRR